MEDCQFLVWNDCALSVFPAVVIGFQPAMFTVNEIEGAFVILNVTVLQGTLMDNVVVQLDIIDGTAVCKHS